MEYISTRGKAPTLDFKGVTLTGLARDGGLYVPASLPTLSKSEISALAGLPYHEVAYRIISPFVADSMSEEALKTLLKDTYGEAFRHKAVAPLLQLDNNHFLLELFHGPTLAFKDFALQALGRFFDEFTTSSDKPLTIVGATSGDTGSAAIEGCRGRDNVRIFMLHPKGRVSDVQRRQMTTVIEPNVVNIAVDGTFDDCQDMVKALFNDHAFRDEVGLTAVNSINWARVMAQVVYYFVAAVALGGPDKEIAFTVPTGNFGDIYAGYVAKQMGLPISKLVIATNSNDILTRTLETGRYERGDVFATFSPSMDIQISSNFERFLFDLVGRDGDEIQRLMDELAETGGFDLRADQLARARSIMSAHRVSDDETEVIIASYYSSNGILLDPHTAVGVGAAEACLKDIGGPHVTLATAHPAKFADAVRSATGTEAPLPDHLSHLMQAREEFTDLDNDLGALKSLILGHAS